MNILPFSARTSLPANQPSSAPTSLLRLLFLLILLLAASLLWPTKAQANVVCNASGSTMISFGNVTVNGSGGAMASGRVNYTCTNYDNSAVNTYICLKGGNSVNPGTVAQPMMSGGTPSLRYNVYTDAAGTIPLPPGNTILRELHISSRNSGQSVISGSIPIYAYFPGNQTSPPGNYSGSLYNNTFGFATSANSTVCQANLNDGSHNYEGTPGITITLNATVINACTVSASDIDFGAITPGTTNLTQTGVLDVKCPQGTTYNIGLSPSNGSTTGAGSMRGTGSNTDQIAYQLRSSPGPAGTIWGNTATATAVGNGVSSIGSGTTRSVTVYATVSDTNHVPDSYTDTVTVYVNY